MNGVLRKLLSVTVSMLLIMVLILSGCAKGSGEKTSLKTTDENASVEETKAEDSSEEVAEDESTEEEMALEEVELLWYMIGTPQDDMDSVLEEVNKITKEAINATVKINIIDWGGYEDKINVLLASGEPMDLCFTSTWSNNYVNGSRNGAFTPLSELLDEYGSDLMDSIPVKYWDLTKVDGEIYGAINYQLMYKQRAAYLRKDLVDKYEFDLSGITTMEELTPLFQTIKDNEPGVYPVMATSENIVGSHVQRSGLEKDYFYVTVAGDAGSASEVVVRSDDETFTALNPLMLDDFRSVHVIRKEWYDKGFIRKDAMTVEDPYNEFKTGSYFSIDQVYKPGGDVEMASRLGFEVVGVPLTQMISGSDAVQATLTAIPVNSANPERAMMLLNLINKDKDLYNLLCHGIEGIHYEKMDDVTVQAIEGSGYTPLLDWEFGNQFNGYFRAGQSNTIWDETKIGNEKANISPVDGFVFNDEPVRNELVALNADDFGKVALMIGMSDVDEVYEYMLKQQEDNNFDLVLEEVQKQLDEWVGQNK